MKSLPQLLSVIRDNSVVIIVGETGCGKTTQLTQVHIPYSTVNITHTHIHTLSSFSHTLPLSLSLSLSLSFSL